MLSCGGEKQSFGDNGGSLTATPFVWKRTRYVYWYLFHLISSFFRVVSFHGAVLNS